MPGKKAKKTMTPEEKEAHYKKQKAKEREKRKKENDSSPAAGDKDKLRSEEEKKLGSRLSKEGRVIYEVSSDGNCLFYAIAHQMECTDRRRISSDGLRKLCAKYLKSHADDFIPFFEESVVFSEYCNQIANTLHWGGSHEIRALSQALQVPITVIQSEGENQIFGDSFPEPPLVLSYHRHQHVLSEHYNSAPLKLKT